MNRYPREARSAAIKCIDCNAPVVETVDEQFVCVGCGASPIQASEQQMTAVSDSSQRARND